MVIINPYLSFNGNCEAAFNFYKSVFGGEFGYLGRYKDMPSSGQPLPESEKDKIMHVSLPISKETFLFGADMSEAMGYKVTFGDNITLSISTETEADTERIFNALSAGGNVTMPLEKTFWAPLFGMLTDKFGINWMISLEEHSAK